MKVKDPEKLEVEKDCSIVHSFASYATFSKELSSQNFNDYPQLLLLSHIEKKSW